MSHATCCFSARRFVATKVAFIRAIVKGSIPLKGLICDIPTKIITHPDIRHLPTASPLRILRPILALQSAAIMKIMLLLILISLLLAAGFLLVYLWAARNGQFDDDYTPSVRILFDDKAPAEEEGSTATNQTTK